MDKLATFTAIFYLFMIIFTWGHSLNNHETPCRSKFSEKTSCEKTEVAIGSAIFWPLYWSWYLQLKDENNEQHSTTN